MVRWEEVETSVERAVGHFAAVTVIEAADSDMSETAIRHVLACGTRELDDALSMLSRMHISGAAYSLLSDQNRASYRAIRRLKGEELLSPSDLDPRVLKDAIAAASVLAKSLRADFVRIKSELSSIS